MPPPSLDWQVSADPTMRRDGPSRSPVPLTVIESARRAVALKENQESGRSTTASVSSEMLEQVIAIADTADPELADERLFGPRTALFLSDCRRDRSLHLAFGPEQGWRALHL
jgi:hypothetical protein